MWFVMQRADTASALRDRNMNIAFWVVSVYLVIGCVVMIATREPEQDGWLWGVILWPLQLAARWL